MTMRSQVQPPAMLAERIQQSERSQQIDRFDAYADADAGMTGPARGDALWYAGARLILDHAQISSPALTDGGRS